MRNKLQLLKSIIALTLFISINTFSVAQPPPPPPNLGHGSGGNNPPGAGAPIGEGFYLLLGLAGMYGGKKVYDLRSQLKVNH